MVVVVVVVVVVVAAAAVVVEMVVVVGLVGWFIGWLLNSLIALGVWRSFCFVIFVFSCCLLVCLFVCLFVRSFVWWLVGFEGSSF